MSRKRVNSGWVYGHHSTSVTSAIEANTVGFDTLLSGSEVRIDGGVPLVGERADYFVERLLIWGQCFCDLISPTTRANTMCNIRVGTIATEEIEFMRDNLLFTEANAEFWGRILRDEMVPAYSDPTYSFDGESLVADASALATQKKNIFPVLGPSHFFIDIQQRFSLQREEDRLILAIGEDTNYFAEGNFVNALFSYKMLVKEYRK